jgi:hypothetical protein
MRVAKERDERLGKIEKSCEEETEGFWVVNKAESGV